MPTIATIVEGRGEVDAVPILLRRIAERVTPGVGVQLPPPIRIRRNQVLKANELERAVELAARQAGADGRILILLDADSDSPGQLAPEVLRRANEARTDRVIRVVLAKTEYEAWFLAAADSIAGQHGTDGAATPPDDPESVTGAKEWLGNRMPHRQRYRPTLHQAALTAIFDLDAARTVPSFDKLWRDVSELLGAGEHHGEQGTR